MIIAPSILSADFGNLERSIHSVQDAEWLHVDVMDGHFVPNITIGPVVISGLRRYTKQVLDVHLMIEQPMKYIDAFLKAGSDRITFHIEATDNPLEVINYIKGKNKKVGLSIKPNTPVDAIKEYLPYIDQVLVMSVEPGFGGQSFMESSLSKIHEVSTLKNAINPELLIAVDGGINEITGNQCKNAGADVLIAGSYIFKSEHPEQKIESLR